MDDDEDAWLTYREAARRVRRSIRTIKRWRRAGMPMSFDPEGMRVVRTSILLKWWRDRMEAWPAHQYRMRALRARQTAQDSESTDSTPNAQQGVTGTHTIGHAEE